MVSGHVIGVDKNLLDSTAMYGGLMLEANQWMIADGGFVIWTAFRPTTDKESTW
jgi:hypothetical protein